jgi:catechol 2,3-dioxygenase-like lactoylglutathione lyase family enzyme
MIAPTGISHVAMVTADLDRYRKFYEQVIGLDTAIVMRGEAADHPRHAILFAGATVVHVFEEPGYNPSDHGISSDDMFRRGRLDHLGFAVPDQPALEEVGDRLVEAGASDGTVTVLGPILSVHYCDPDGFHGEINCFNPTFVAPCAGALEEIVDRDWVERTRAALTNAADR